MSGGFIRAGEIPLLKKLAKKDAPPTPAQLKPVEAAAAIREQPDAGGPSKAGRGFSQIRHSFLRDSHLSPAARWLGTIVTSFADRARVAWPGLKLLRKLTGLGEKRLKAARRELVKCGALKWVQLRNGGRFGRVRYEIGDAILHPREENHPKRS
jgi:hypothetical protein